MSKNTTPQNNRPRILVLEALSGSCTAVFEAGGQPVKVSPRSLAALDTIESGDWDGLLLTGGADVDPRRYGQKPHRSVYGVNETRDETEIYALEAAREWGLPVLGICRGSQIMNVEAGGTLVQDMRGHRGGDHLLLTEPDSMLRAICPQTNKYVVTLHHQCMDRVADGFTISGIAPDGTPEAIESSDKRCLGVQFHPEMAAYRSYSRNIFRWLVVASAKVNDLPVPETRYPSYIGNRDAPQPQKQKGRNRKAGQKTAPKQAQLALVERTGQGTKQATKRQNVPGLTSRWICRDPHCRIPEFDKIQDRDDHERLVHGFSPEDFKVVR